MRHYYTIENLINFTKKEALMLLFSLNTFMRFILLKICFKITQINNYYISLYHNQNYIFYIEIKFL